MKKLATGVAFALMLAPVLAHAEEKGTTSTTSEQAKPETKDAQKTAGNPMNTPDTARSDTTRTAATPATQEKLTDARLVTLMQKVNKEEIEAGKLAQKKGQSADIKNFGKKLVADHTKSQHEVAAAAKKAKISASDSTLTLQDKEQEKIGKNKMDQLKRLSGAEFDKAFAQEMSNDHDHMISLLRDHKGDLQSDELKTLVDNTLPVLEQHKDMADKAMSKQSASSGSTQGRPAPAMDRSSSSPDKSAHPGTGDDSAKSGATGSDKK